MTRRTRRRILASVLVWALLTAGGALVHSLAWNADTSPGVWSPLGETAGKMVSNLSQVLTLPGWIVVWLGMKSFDAPWAAALATGIGWACLMLSIWVVLALRRGARRWLLTGRLQAAPPVPPAAPASPTDDTGRATAVAPCGAAAPDGVNGPEAAQSDQRPRNVGRRAGAFASRRAFLLDGALVSTALVGGAAGAHAVLVGPWSLVVRRHRVVIPGLPRSLDGLRLVQVSDTHLGPRIPRSHIEQAVRLARSLRPDLFVLTGDYVHMGRSHIAPAAELFRPLTEPAARGGAPLGALGVLGNHDFYADGPAMSRALRDIGVRMIDNDRVFIDAASRRLTPLTPDGPSGGLCIAGLGDLLEDLIDPRRAFADVPADMPRIVLAHNPDTAEHPMITGVTSRKFYPADPPSLGGEPWRAPRIDLMLSGHTHGGQVRVPFLGTPGIPSRFGQKYASGLVPGPVCPVLVSAGVGMSVLPVRVGVPPELVELTLAAS